VQGAGYGVQGVGLGFMVRAMGSGRVKKGGTFLSHRRKTRPTTETRDTHRRFDKSVSPCSVGVGACK